MASSDFNMALSLNSNVSSVPNYDPAKPDLSNLLPNELWDRIFEYFDIKNCVKLGCLSKRFKSLTRDNNLMQKKIIKCCNPLLFENATYPKARGIGNVILDVKNNQIICGFMGTISPKDYSKQAIWTNLYDFTRKIQSTIANHNENYRSNFARLLNNRVVEVSDDNELNAYGITEECKIDFQLKISKLSNCWSRFTTDHNSQNIAVSLEYASSIKIYKEDDRIVGLNNPTQRHLFSNCKSMCFAGNRLVAFLDASSMGSYTNDEEVRNHPRCIQSYNIETGDTENTIYLEDELVLQMEGDDKTLVSVNGKKDWSFRIAVLNPENLEEKFSLTNETLYWESLKLLKVQDNKIVTITNDGQLEIFDTQSGKSIFTLKKDWYSIRDVEVDNNFAAIIFNQLNIIEIWHLDKTKITELDTVSFPEQIKFRCESKNQAPHLVAALNDGQVQVWSPYIWALEE